MQYSDDINLIKMWMIRCSHHMPELCDDRMWSLLGWSQIFEFDGIQLCIFETFLQWLRTIYTTFLLKLVRWIINLPILVTMEWDWGGITTLSLVDNERDAWFGGSKNLFQKIVNLFFYLRNALLCFFIFVCYFYLFALAKYKKNMI